VAASCAGPGLFAPVEIDGREYVDGGVWSPTNLDLARAGAGDHVLCLVPTAVMGPGPAVALRGLAAGWRLATAVEAAAARRRGASVEIVAPDAGAARAIGTDLMNPARRNQVLAAGFRQGSGRAG
jgi:NTE family protein